jgi:EAL domain-containing protein (putative c-di-GMP-specific phosphodiesterase class I)/GGDEF domain-containing protein
VAALPAAAPDCSGERHYRMALDTSAIAASLPHYGLDARARSALQAFDRFCGGERARQARFADLLQAFPPPDHDASTVEPHRRFIALLADLPGSDLSGEWLDHLLRSWLGLYAGGCSPDLPAQATRHVVAGAVAALGGGRGTVSRIESDIMLALNNAGFFLCGVLAETAHGFDRSRRREVELFDAETGLPNARQLPLLLADCIDANPSGVTGLLLASLDVGAATLALDDDTRVRLHARSVLRLSDCLRECDLLCRTGRSEIAVVLPNLRSSAQVMLAASKLLGAIERPLALDNRPYGLTAHIGGVHTPDHGIDPAGLLRGARLAMHMGRVRGVSCALFDSAMQTHANEEAECEREFLAALDGDRLQLHFQPQVDVASGRCAGVEALLRWRTGRGIDVPPPRIIDMATRIGALARLTRWIINAACRATGELRQAGLELGVSVNLTASDIGDPDLPLAVNQAVELWRIDAATLTFELTETAMLASQAAGAKVLNGLRALGASTSIDDFGTGYSSVLNLKVLPFNELKIDKSFVLQMTQSAQDREIVRSLIQLAHGLRLEVVAEGVEDDATVELLRDCGCERVQGFLFSKALPLPQLIRWVRGFERPRPGDPDLGLRVAPRPPHR